MADYDDMTPGEVLADASVADFIASLGRGIADAQQELDRNSIEQLDSFTERLDGLGGKSLMELGFSPAFYHYQHADLSCSLNIRLKVAKETGFDLGLAGAFGQTEQESASSASSLSETESGTSTRTEIRTAELRVQNASAGLLTVGGAQYSVDEERPFMDRVSDLADELRADGAVDAVRMHREAAELSISTSADTDKVLIGPNSVAFVNHPFRMGYIRISLNESTTVVLDEDHTVSVDAADDTESLARELSEKIDEIDGYTAAVAHSSSPWGDGLKFGTGRSEVEDEHADMLQRIARVLRESSLSFRLVGKADRQGHEDWSKSYKREFNQDLSEDRANAVRDALLKLAPDIDPQRIEAIGRGEDRAVEEDHPADNPSDRVVEVYPAESGWYISVEAGDDVDLEDVSPDLTSGGEGNGWIGVFRSLADGEDGETVTIEGQSFTLKGARDGYPHGAPETYAANLAADVNDESDFDVVANARGPICHLARPGDSTRFTLYSSGQSELQIEGSQAVTVTRQFSRTSSEREVRRRTGNRTVAVGASVDVRYSRQFELDVTGNSSITARLVSVPAPPEFLDTIREFLKD